MGIKREDGFSKLMAAVVDDTAVMYNTYTGNWFAADSPRHYANNRSPLPSGSNCRRLKTRQ